MVVIPLKEVDRVKVFDENRCLEKLVEVGFDVSILLGRIDLERFLWLVQWLLQLHGTYRLGLRWSFSASLQLLN